jgi:methionyl-tRNA formyltransferase
VERFVRGVGALSGVPLIAAADASGDAAVIERMKGSPVDVTFVTDFGQLVREPLLAWEDRIGCLNIHPSMLPLYRGAAPVQRVLMDGLAETGVTIFKLARAMDSGPILLQRKLAIGPGDDAGSLLDRAAYEGVRAFVEYVSSVSAEEWRFSPQDGSLATTAPKITREEERIDWTASAREILGKIRALSPKPGAWTTAKGRRLRILQAGECRAVSVGLAGELTPGSEGPLVASGAGSICLKTVQMEGKKIQSAADWWNGIRAAAGECLV